MNQTFFARPTIAIVMAGLILSTLACTDDEPRRDKQPREPGYDAPGFGGPNNPIDLRPAAGPQSIDVDEVRVDAELWPGTSPVAARLPDGELAIGYVHDGAWLAIGDDHIPLDAAATLGLPTEALAMTSSRDGTLHLVWSGGDIYYATWNRADGLSNTTLVGSGRDATIALSPAGAAVIAWTQGDANELADQGLVPQILVRTETNAGSADFGEVQVASPGCCAAAWDGGETTVSAMSGPSLAIDPADGSVHVVYEWSRFGQTVIEYRSDRDDFASRMVISDIAYSPCPALVVDGDGVHITYLTDWSGDVLYRRIVDGEMSDEMNLTQLKRGAVNLALMHRDRDGVFHLLVSRYDGGPTIVSYSPVVLGQPISTFMDIDAQPEYDGLQITPRSGGFVLTSSGELLAPLAYKRDEQRTVGIAVGR